MSLIDTVVLFEGVVTGTGPVYSDPRLSSLLARADEMAVQISLSNITGGSPTVTLVYQATCNGTVWDNRQTLLNAVPLGSSTYDSMEDATGFVNASQGRFELSFGGTGPTAFVRIMAALRSK